MLVSSFLSQLSMTPAPGPTKTCRRLLGGDEVQQSRNEKLQRFKRWTLAARSSGTGCSVYRKPRRDVSA